MKRRVKVGLPRVQAFTPAWERVNELNWYAGMFTPKRLFVKQLIATQPSVLIKGVNSVDWRRPIFVVRIADKYYIRDGHHRVQRALNRNQQTIQALVLVLPEENLCA